MPVVPSAKTGRWKRTAARFCVSCETLLLPSDGALCCDFCKEPFIKKTKRGASPAPAAPAVSPAPKIWVTVAAALAAAALALSPHGRAPAQPTLFDASRDSVRDVSQALNQARSSGKLVLIEVGGDWCQWSMSLERLFAADHGLAKLRDENFITVKVYQPPVVVDLHGLDPAELRAAKAAAPRSMLPSEALSRYPAIAAFPYLMVLDRDGNLLRGKDLEEYERGESYDAAGIRAFLRGT